MLHCLVCSFGCFWLVGVLSFIYTVYRSIVRFSYPQNTHQSLRRIHGQRILASLLGVRASLVAAREGIPMRDTDE